LIAIIFEVLPRAGRREAYLELAVQLRPVLEKMDGFLSVERFESLTTPGKMLSLSFWRDEEAVKAWRELSVHRSAQERGRGAIFEDYRLRVAAVVRDYGMSERAQAPRDSVRFHSVPSPKP
jgi:heme-degrading monooxygenase HmoA